MDDLGGCAVEGGSNFIWNVATQPEYYIAQEPTLSILEITVPHFPDLLPASTGFKYSGRINFGQLNVQAEGEDEDSGQKV